MKKIVSLVLVCVLLVGTLFALTSCSKTLSGTYETGVSIAKVTYTFSGSKVNLKYTLFGQEISVDGKYSIAKKDDAYQITFTFDDKDKDQAGNYAGTYSFSETDDGSIVIGGVTYKKAK